MDWERWRVNAEIYGLKARAKLKILFMAAGIVLVFVGAYNMLAEPYLNTPRVAAVPALGYVGSEGSGIFLLGDVVAIAAGAVIVWLS
ncbi:hypothetical protein [Haloarcula laminariae]|uniref:hypothetical protein n=1 Tax=Haloarcula laminariae TaxID=2961577 RepID=UPI0021CA75F7|nr:hypothetical protein [Halomicroarcula laminariae]